MQEDRRKNVGRFPQNRATRFVCVVITTIVVVVLVVVFIVWVSLQPHKPKYYLNHGSLSQFALSDGLVTSRFDFNLTTRNSNKKIGIYYDKIGTALAYDGDEFAWGGHLPFYQGHKNTTTLHTVLSGDTIALQGERARDLKLEQNAGKVDLEFRLFAIVRFKVGSWKSGHYTLKVRCRHLMLDVASGSFQSMRCKVHV